jgi:hypothetical protein
VLSAFSALRLLSGQRVTRVSSARCGFGITVAKIPVGGDGTETAVLTGGLQMTASNS